MAATASENGTNTATCFGLQGLLVSRASLESNGALGAASAAIHTPICMRSRRTGCTSQSAVRREAQAKDLSRFGRVRTKTRGVFAAAPRGTATYGSRCCKGLEGNGPRSGKGCGICEGNEPKSCKGNETCQKTRKKAAKEMAYAKQQEYRAAEAMEGAPESWRS